MAYIYSLLRAPLYVFLFMVSAALLGLTAERIHFTRSTFGTHDKIIAELLVASILTLLYAPYAAMKVLGTNRSRTKLWHELLPLFILWVMWLVGGAIATNNWPRTTICGAVPGTRQCKIITAIVALTWIGFGTLTAIMVLALMHAAANHGAYGTHNGASGYNNGGGAFSGPVNAGPGGAGVTRGELKPNQVGVAP